MPYITQENREKLAAIDLVCDVFQDGNPTPGDINYLIARIADAYAERYGVEYRIFNDIVGAIESSKHELQRRFLDFLEDQKIVTNGDEGVYPYLSAWRKSWQTH